MYILIGKDMETVINIHVVAGWEVQPAYIPFQRLEKYWSHRIISPAMIFEAT